MPSSLSYVISLYSIIFVVCKLFDVGRRRGLHVVRVGLGVVVLQDRLQSAALFLPALLGTRHCCRQALCREQRLLPGRQVARLYDIFYRVLN